LRCTPTPVKIKAQQTGDAMTAATQPLKIIVNGAKGRMGQAACRAIEGTEDLQLVAALGKGDDLAEAIHSLRATIVIDLTVASVAFENTRSIIQNGAHPIIGTTGLTPAQVTELQHLASEHQRGGIIAPNFSLGAILLMQFSSLAARYFPNAEIIEAHHPGKQEAPSGTAIKTATLIAEHRAHEPTHKHYHEVLPHARGASYEHIAIHSVRLPGVLAEQHVIFGGSGEQLILQHRTLDRDCFMPGLLLCCRQVTSLDHLIYGMENLIT
jgi:4-hydroxy-tetrahydrodipicolinate reductase